MFWRYHCALKISNNLSHEKKNETAVPRRLIPSYYQMSCDNCAQEGQKPGNQNVALLKSCKPVIKCSSLFWVQLMGGNRHANYRQVLLYTKICS